MQQRQDIQALRGIAITLVLLDHADIPYCNGGFLGVDIFFVISGFLITGSIAHSLQAGSFSFREFYFRRARRILPAALTTVALTIIGAIWFMGSAEMIALKEQVRGALTFTINFVLAKDVDYFDISAHSKPLLHMWSLAVEEQFYLLLPVILVFTPQRLRRITVLALTVLSFAFCLYFVRIDEVRAFYLLPSRAWELGVGGCAALYAPSMPRMRWAFWPACVVMLTLPFVADDFQHPGAVAAVLCLATAIILLANNASSATSLPVRALAAVGDISYSLYLVHWPVMVFAYAAYLGAPPAYAGPLNIVLSLLLAQALYRGVERPVITRLRRPSWAALVCALAATLAVALTYTGSARIAQPRHDWASLRAPNYGFNAHCDYSGQRFVPKPECQNGEQPTLMVWGDSYAMHLVPGVAERQAVIQATFSTCAPFLGYAPKRSNVRKPELWARRCIAFSNDVLAFLEKNSSIKTVILSSPWRSWVAAPATVWSLEDNKLVKHVTSIPFVVESLGATIRAIQALGKQVVLFGPPPSVGGDPSACLERKLEGKVLADDSCDIDRQAALRYDLAVNQFLDQTAQEYGVQVMRVADALCGAHTCITESDGVPIYRDSGHLSNAGSKMVFELLRSAGKTAAIEGLSASGHEAMPRP